MNVQEFQARQTGRGCPEDCTCADCCSDELDVTRARWGLDVEEGRRWEDLCRQAVGGPRRRGNGSGTSSSGTGRRSPRRPAASPKQLDFIASLFAQADLDPQLAQSLADQTYQDEFDIAAASSLIDVLKSLPKRPREPRQTTPQQTEGLVPGQLFWPKAADEVAEGAACIRVQESRNAPGRLFGVLLFRDGSTDFRSGLLRPDRLGPELTLAEAREFGRESGVCAVCARRLTNPDSIEAGIGPICSRRWG